MGFKEIDHQADLAFEVWGKDEIELLESIISLLEKLFGIKKLENVIVKYETFHYETFEDLIFEVGNELIYLFTKHNLFPKDLNLNIDRKKLEIGFSKVISKNEEELSELKALTYHKLELDRSERLLRTYLIFDV
ncbi:MAG: archease [Thermotogae bacterium]|nr:archease [Thermotogota bacterium]